jgi:hypothetical protein
MSKSQMPPTPPAARSDKGPTEARESERSRPSNDPSFDEKTPANPEQQGRHGNIQQNTHHQGYQQDR